MNNKWVWLSLKVIAILVILSHLYFEGALVLKLFILPSKAAAGALNYHEGLGLFAPVIYMFEGGIKLLEGLSPIVKFVQQILFIVNSVLLIVSIIISRYVFKKKLWAGIVIILLSSLSLILWFG